MLAICGLVYSQVMPSVSAMYQNSRAISGINWIVGAINFARISAVKHGVTVTLCPAKSASPQKCEDQWPQDGLIIFADFNQNAVLDDGKDYLIKEVAADHIEGTLTWRSFRNKAYLQITRLGHTNNQNGNFVFCPAAADPALAQQFARQIKINRQGRVRLMRYKKNPAEDENDNILC